MNEYLSNKIRYVKFFSVIAVVFIHSYNYADSYLLAETTISEGFNIFAMMQYFISNGITRFAIPIFFILSGYLFFRNFDLSFKGYFAKIKSRFFSLVIPFVVWVIISGFVIYLCSE
ncbi:MAG: acyltransferase family protein, partial [Acutalibacteraceae bacterium]